MIGGEVKYISVDLTVYADIGLFIQKGKTMTWKQIKSTFAKDFRGGLEK